MAPLPIDASLPTFDHRFRRQTGRDCLQARPDHLVRPEAGRDCLQGLRAVVVASLDNSKTPADGRRRISRWRGVTLPLSKPAADAASAPA